MQGAQRYVIFTYLALGVLLWVTLAKVLGAAAYAVDVPDPALLGSNFTLSTLLGALGAIGAGIYAMRNERVYGFSTEVVTELRKVTWPSRKETQTATVVVMITTIIVSLILGLYDWVWGLLTSVVYKT